MQAAPANSLNSPMLPLSVCLTLNQLPPGVTSYKHLF